MPQILTNDAEQFLDTCNMLTELGYHEVNLNLGCPAATVVSKRKGSGFLDEPGKLDRFFESIFEDVGSSVAFACNHGRCACRGLPAYNDGTDLFVGDGQGERFFFRDFLREIS